MPQRKLPEEFILRMRECLGENELQKYLECMNKPMEHGLRVNTLRMEASEFEKLSAWKLERIPWCPGGFYLDEDAGEDPPSRHPLYYAGAYYLQEPSAMLPAAVLPVEPGNRVLDLCAAPGGKSTALAEKLRGKGYLVCNDISASRAKALIKNLELFGVTNAIVTAETPERLSQAFPDHFDRILIDAPCSGEGMFRKSASMIADWTADKPGEYAAIQREILEYAVKMLRPGGMIMYSTCTYAPDEDEGSVQYLLDLPEAKEKKLRLESIPECPGFLPGHPEWITGGTEELKKTFHLIPHRVRGEGHFAALLKSDAVSGTEASYTHAARPGKYPELEEFTCCMKYKWPAERLQEQNGYLSLLPEDAASLTERLRGLRVLRRGLYLGEIKKKRFEPSQALAMVLSEDTFSNCLSLKQEDERVLKYLKGETLEYNKNEVRDGWVLITYMGLPLGFGKAKNGLIKNKYLPGWRFGA